MRIELALRFDYGRSVPWVTRLEDGALGIAGPDMVVLRTAAPLRGENLKIVSEFTIYEGPSSSPMPAARDNSARGRTANN